MTDTLNPMDIEPTLLRTEHPASWLVNDVSYRSGCRCDDCVNAHIEAQRVYLNRSTRWRPRPSPNRTGRSLKTAPDGTPYPDEWPTKP
jgi:hypothetical protein